MKKQVYFFIAGMLTFQTFSYAQNATAIVAGSRNGSTFVGNAGKYDMNNISQDNTQIMLKVLDQNRDVQKADREFLLSTVARFNSHLKEIAELKIKFDQLSQKASLGTVNFEEYLNLVNQIKAKNSILEVELATQTSISRESLPSYSAAAAGDAKASVSTYGNIDLSALTGKINNVRGSLLADINNSQFKFLLTPLGQTISVNANALSPDLSKIAILSSDKIQELDEEIKLLTTMKRETKVYQQQFVDKSVTLINSFVESYGTSEWLRFQDANDSDAMKISFKNITDAFYGRSYLRKKYGLRMGAIQTKGYPKSIANVERIGMALQPMKIALSSLRREAALTDVDVQSAFESARNFVQLFDEKTTAVLQDAKKTMAGKKAEFSVREIGFVVRANSSITYLTGQRQTAEVLLMVMRLVLADAREEMMLLQNDRDALAAYHDAKYRSTDEVKKESNIRICKIDYMLSVDAHTKNCAPLGVARKAVRPTSNGGSSIVEIFSNLMAQYENVEKSRRQEADMKQQLLEAARSALKTDADKKEEDNLFN